MQDSPASETRPRRRRVEANPLLLKELRGRMRGARAFVVLTVYLLLLSCFASIVYYAVSSSYSSYGSAPDMAEIGMTVFISVALIQVLMVTFITPAFTAGAISGERERKTYELLQTTLLPPRRVVSGKLTAALSYVLLLIMAAIPLEGLAFMLGGVIVEELLVLLLILLVTMLSFGALGLLFSSFARTTLAATVLSYVTALLVTIGLPLLLLLGTAIADPFMYGYGISSPSWVVRALLYYALYISAGLSPLTAAIFTKVILEDYGSIWIHFEYVDSHTIPIPSTWIIYTIVYLGVTLVALLVTMWRVRRMEEK